MKHYPGVFKKRTLGLSAPQIGYSKRFILFANIEAANPQSDITVCYNPRLVSTSPETNSFSESCLSDPSRQAQVTRPNSCTIEYNDMDGKLHVHASRNQWESRIILHEMDHLEGIDMTQRAHEVLLSHEWLEHERLRRMLRNTSKAGIVRYALRFPVRENLLRIL